MEEKKGLEKRPLRDSWGSKIGFILATSGAAVGLGNIQRFPYMTAQYGGAAFVVVYLLCVLFLGLPLILVELALGRHTQRNPVAAIASIRPGSPWRYVGLLGIATAFFILCYYVVMAGWTLAYAWQMAAGRLMPIDEFAASAGYVIPCTVAFLLITMLVVRQGLQRGVERSSKVLMPLLVVLLLALAIRCVSLPGSVEGIRFYLMPDFSKINGEVVLQALGQAFFSLCIGEAVLITYGSYVAKTENLVASAIYIAVFDTSVALLAGFVIFPALAAFHQQPDHQGVGLIFNIMPVLFSQMPFGSLLGVIFFVILAFAGLTTCIALLEIPVAYLKETYGVSRDKAVWRLGLLALTLAIPAALSKGASDFWSGLTLGSLVPARGLYEVMDFVWGSLSMVLGGLLVAIFTAWVWGGQQAAKELSLGCPGFLRVGRLWAWHIRFLAPCVILWILCGLFR